MLGRAAWKRESQIHNLINRESQDDNLINAWESCMEKRESRWQSN